MKYDGLGFFDKAAHVRLKDAKTLLESGRKGSERGAIYIGGYSAECALKVLLILHAPNTTCSTLRDAADAYRKANPAFPDLLSAKGHSLQLLFEHCETDAGYIFSSEARQHFGVVRKWQYSWRYLAEPPKPDFARQFVSALDRFIHEIQ